MELGIKDILNAGFIFLAFSSAGWKAGSKEYEDVIVWVLIGIYLFLILFNIL